MPPPARTPAAGMRRRGVVLPVILLLLTLLLLLHRMMSSSRPLPALREPSHSQACDYSDGEWVRDASAGSSLRYDHTCKEIFKGWNCIANGKVNARDMLRWRWKPSSPWCELPRLDPLRFLELHRNTNIGFVGDSLNRNMFVSLVCMLRGDKSLGTLWWSASSNGGPLESLGYKQGYRIDVDVPDQTWTDASSFHDILIFNTGHWWWAPSKFDPTESPMLFFEKGKPIIPPLPPPAGLDLALKHMITFVDKAMRPNHVKFFRTQSPRHFEGGDWNEGGSCQHNQPLSSKEVEEFFSLDNNGTNVEVRLVNQHLMKALEQSTFRVLDITRMSEFRADAHPSTTGGKRHDDCMHWCLPGPTDTWNDLLAANLEAVRS
ncbi:hypothetical protein PR202_gb20872 [Eleusine coracana subsp. coracana]|uniref:Trichome birefringence-like N-terminal domain-containing protein n=1 Tax=Eleusine coracana subsp. coracana TaxID=191504 RepID=A0AAV5FBR7_ELECO|nr:hypothetical protein PR202_gb20872 [Eleusine coracana subsp. coracana]